MSSPMIAAGNSPTADSTENRPPTPSGTGNISRQPTALARSNSLPLVPVTGTTRSASWARLLPSDSRSR